jgi:hypothetical protein
MQKKKEWNDEWFISVHEIYPILETNVGTKQANVMLLRCELVLLLLTWIDRSRYCTMHCVLSHHLVADTYLSQLDSLGKAIQISAPPQSHTPTRP